MKPRLFSLTRCVAPVTTENGVLPCVCSGEARSGTCSDHKAWRSFVWPLRILWTLKRWWPNELGRAMDRTRAGVQMAASQQRPRHNIVWAASAGDAERLITLLNTLEDNGLDRSGPLGRALRHAGDLATVQDLAALTSEQLADYERLFAQRETAAANSAAQRVHREGGH